MKKFHFIALAVCCGFLWACHKDEPTVDPYANAPWAVDETLPVPILVSTPDQTTKSDAITSLAGVKLKVIGYDLNVGSASLLYDKELDAVGVGTGIYNENPALNSPGSIQFKNGNQNVTYYYPMGNASSDPYNFTFFAFHVPDGTDPGTFGANGHYTVSFPLDPTGTATNQDILVASASATNYSLATDLLNDDNSVRYEADDYSGFNARYQRITYLDGYRNCNTDQNEDGEVDATDKQIAAQANVTLHQPKLYFAHCTARVIINAKAADAIAESSFTTSGLKMQLIYLLQAGAHERVKLDVTAATGITSANYNAPNVQVLDWDTSSAEKTTGYDMTTMSTAVKPVVTPGARLHNDDCLYIVPGDYALTIKYKITDDNSDPLTLEKSINPPSGGFLPGRTYTYNLTIDSSQAIQLTGYLGQWDDVGGSQEDLPVAD